MMPKHHQAQHLALDAFRFGPPRGYWCFAFEALHQKVKGFARGGTYVNVGERVLSLWCRELAQILYEQRMAERSCQSV